MVISGVDGNSTSGMTPLRPPSGNANDEVSRGLEQQIQQKQKELAELKQDDTMSAEQKMKRRQELQKEISELQMQTRQHEMEVRQKERQEQNAARQEKDNLEAENGQADYGKRTQGKQGGMDMAISNVMTKSMLSAGSSMKMAKLQQGARKQAQGKANVLKAEIKQSGGSGKDVERKQKEVEAMEDKAAKLESQQISSLSDLNEQIRKDAQKDQKVAQEEKVAEKKRADKAAEKKKAEKIAREKAEEKRIEERKEKSVQMGQNAKTVEVDNTRSIQNGIDGDQMVSTDITATNTATETASSITATIGGKVDVVI